MAYRVLARAARAEGDPAAAQEFLDKAMKSAVARGSRREVALTRLEEADRLAAAGEVGGADTALREARGAFERMGMTWYEGEAKRRREP